MCGCVSVCVGLAHRGAVRRLVQSAAGEPPVVSGVATLFISVQYTTSPTAAHDPQKTQRFVAVIPTIVSEGAFAQIVLMNLTAPLIIRLCVSLNHQQLNFWLKYAVQHER